MSLRDILDARRRAMLEEMGVRLWWPQPESPARHPSAEPAPDTAVQAQGPDAAAVPPTPVLPVTPVTPLTPVAPVTLPGEGDWADLAKAVDSCTACGLCRGRTQTVFGAGSQQAHWMLVGEAPGEEEDQTGMPFVGRSGRLLDSMLGAMSLVRGTQNEDAPASRRVFITNVLKCRPPGNRNPQADEVLQCLPYLHQQIALLQPRIILALGRFAALALLQGSVPDARSPALGTLRGQVHRVSGIPMVVTFHPSYLLRNPAEKAKVWADLCLALDVAEGVPPHPGSAPA